MLILVSGTGNTNLVLSQIFCRHLLLYSVTSRHFLYVYCHLKLIVVGYDKKQKYSNKNLGHIVTERHGDGLHHCSHSGFPINSQERNLWSYFPLILYTKRIPTYTFTFGGTPESIEIPCDE